MRSRLAEPDDARRSGRSPTAAVALPVAALLLAGALVACGSRARSPGPPAATGTPTSAPAPAPAVWPLTGVPATGPLDRPALAVKIENSLDARPQTGLNAADLVWEEVVEGGITRFVAVYHSTLPPEIGPVRSVRPMDPAIAAPLHGLFAFSGGIPDFVDAVAAAGLQVLSSDSADGYYRVGSRAAPHNLYANPQALVNQADPAHRAAPPAQFVVAGPGRQTTALELGVPCGTVQLTLSPGSHPRWTWSQPDGVWLRAEDGEPAVGADGGQLRAANVVMLDVDVVDTPFVDAAGNPVPATQLIGSGPAVVASGGRSLAATWSKASLGEPVALTGTDGQPVRLAAGTTWVELVPHGSGTIVTG